MLGIDGKVPSRPPISQSFTPVLQNCEKSAVKHSIEKLVLLNFGDLSIKQCLKIVY